VTAAVEGNFTDRPCNSNRT